MHYEILHFPLSVPRKENWHCTNLQYDKVLTLCHIDLALAILVASEGEKNNKKEIANVR